MNTSKQNSKRREPDSNKSQSKPKQKIKSGNSMSSSRGAAIRAQKRNQEDAKKMVEQYNSAPTDQPKKRANVITEDFDKLKVSFLGGLDDVGEKNTAIIEYQNSAVIVDCGNNLVLTCRA